MAEIRKHKAASGQSAVAQALEAALGAPVRPVTPGAPPRPTADGEDTAAVPPRPGITATSMPVTTWAVTTRPVPPRAHA